MKGKKVGANLKETELLPVLRYIEEYRQAEGMSPTLRGLMSQFGLTSTSVASYRIDALRLKGWLTIRPNQPRSARATAAGLVKLQVNGRPTLLAAAQEAYGILTRRDPRLSHSVRKRKVDALRDAIRAAGGTTEEGGEEDGAR